MTKLLIEGLDAHERNRLLTKTLGQNYCNVTFTKKDGSVRKMFCTLMTEAMPEFDANKFHQTRIYTPELLKVWDLEKSEWRSFHTLNVLDVEICPKGVN